MTITGTVDGSTGVAESLTFSANGTKATTKRFTAISGITTSGLASEATVPTVSVQAIGPDGSVQSVSYLLKGPGYPYLLTEYNQRWPAMKQGTVELDLCMILFPLDPSWTPREGDVWKDDQTGEQWQLQGVMRRGAGTFGSMFYQCPAARRQNSV